METKNDYPSSWGTCERVLIGKTPDSIRVFENVISGDFYAIVDDRDAPLGILTELGVTEWTYGTMNTQGDS